MKTPKPKSTKKPPVPSDSHEGIENWIKGMMPGLQPILRHLDEQICDSFSNLKFSVKWKKAYYGTPNLGWVIELVAYDVSVNLVFLAGAKFENPPQLGDESRYIKIRTLDEAKLPEIRFWIAQAGKTEGWKW